MCVYHNTGKIVLYTLNLVPSLLHKLSAKNLSKPMAKLEWTAPLIECHSVIL